MIFEYARFREERKGRVKILILGPYFPPESTLNRLEKLRDCLQKNGFNNAKLVKDFPDEERYDKDKDIHFTKKSRYLIQNWSHILVFVFLDANNSGVTSELIFTTSKAKEKLRRSVSMFQKDVHFSTQIKGPVKIEKIYAEEFNDDEELCDLVEGYCIQFLDQIIWDL